MKKKAASAKAKRIASTRGLFVPLALLVLSAFVLLSFAGEKFDAQALVAGGVLLVLLYASYRLFGVVFPECDRHLMIIVDALISVGIVVQYRITPDTALKQLLSIGIGLVAMFVVAYLFTDTERLCSRKLCYLLMAGSVCFLALPMVFGDEQFGAKNWIDLGFFSLQPSELIKVVLVFVLSVWLAEKTRFRDLLIPGAFLVCLMGLLMLERDLGAVLIFAGATIAVYYAATGNKLVVAGGLAAGGGAAYLCYLLFSHVRVRVQAWQNPWADYYNSGYQVAQGLMAIASGGLFGMGLTQGTPKSIPAYNTDYIFAVICEEFGIVFGLCVVALYVLFLLRGISTAFKCTDRFSALMALGCTATIALQAFIILGGIIKLIPLTGVTMPFVSYGGSSMLSGLIAVGVLEGIAVQNHRRREVGKEQ